MSSLRGEVRQAARGFRWGRTPLVPASAQAEQPALEPRRFPTTWARSPAAVAVRSVVQRAGLTPLVRSQVSLHVTGTDVLRDLAGPVVFVANHSSHLDAPLVLTTLPDRWRRTTAVAAASDYFFDTWPRAIGSTMAFSTFPMERRGGGGTSLASDLLLEGWSLLVFPEGTRSEDGAVGDYRRGAALLALTAEVPVVPISIRGSYAAMPKGRSWPVPGRAPVRVRYGQPLTARASEDAAALTTRIAAEVRRLGDEDATDWYASMRRASAAVSTAEPVVDRARWRRVWAATEPPVSVSKDRRSPWRR